MNKRNIIIARILMLLYIAAIAFICFGHFDSLPKVSDSIFGIETDKLVHFAMFLPFPILAYFSTGTNPKGPWKALLIVLGILLAGCIIAAATEVVQSMIPDRDADPKDFFADTLALGISSLAVFIIMLVKGTRASKQ